MASAAAYEIRLNEVLRAGGQVAEMVEMPPVAALPGNHDWYDGLGAFRRNFCESWVRRDHEHHQGHPQAIDIPSAADRDDVGGWGAFQSRSYFAVQLSPRWWLWAVDSQLDAPIDAIFSCAGVADGTPGILLINFIAHRHLIERLVGDGKVPAGSAIAFISSVAGLGWQTHLERALDFLSSPDWDAATKWIEAHDGTDNYSFSKQAINAYVAHEAYRFLQRGIRLNAIAQVRAQTIATRISPKTRQPGQPRLSRAATNSARQAR